ncbi:hypothetical protein UUU_35670 [Klebsiella pneumoniae subsp. pneumoniae DSM 30104 = JCM 1662 = NBRC 14940]|nr:hypothetical protein UUU_35670 [Klebsiella pneumoniae subsp. pneumoniae DSM 30104 = JCM 1662 = NBRC 14940]
MAQSMVIINDKYHHLFKFTWGNTQSSNSYLLINLLFKL